MSDALERKIKYKIFSISYTDVGSGEVILFIHGWMTSNKVFEPIINILSKKYRCIAIDVPGFGESSVIGKVTLPKIVKYISLFVTKLGINRHFLVGDSMGGAISILYEKRNPDRVNKMVLISPFINFQQLSKLIYYLLRYILPDLLYSKIIVPIFKIMLIIINLSSKFYQNKVIDILGNKSVKNKAKNAFYVVFQLLSLDLYSLLKVIDKEILVIYGSKDSLLNILPIKPLLDLYTNIHLSVFKNARHYIFSFDPEKLSTKINNFFSSQKAD